MHKQHGNFLSNGFRCSDPTSAATITLLGGHSHEGTAVTRPQMEELKRLYGVTPEDSELAESVAISTTFRRTSFDGMRCMAILSKFVEAGEDPALFLTQVLGEAGYDVHTWEKEEDRK